MAKQTETRKRKKQSRYPWLKWFTRKRLTLLRGRDYHTPSYSFAQQVRNWGRRYRVGSLSIRVEEESLVVSVEKPLCKGREEPCFT